MFQHDGGPIYDERRQMAYVANALPQGTNSAIIQQLSQMVNNMYTMRREMIDRGLDPRRNIERECGLPLGYVSPEQFWGLYDRGAIPARVVEVLPEETWQTTPEVYEKESGEVATEFEDAWDALSKNVRGERCWYQDEDGNPIWEALKRLDVLSGVGQYGVLLLGLDDGLDLRLPAQGVDEQGTIPSKPVEMKDKEGKKTGQYGFAPKNNRTVKRYSLNVNAEQVKGRKLLYLRVFPEIMAQVAQYESNPASPRFGMPLMYSLIMGDPRDASSAIAGQPSRSLMVHWTRVIHVADNIRSNECFGTPRMRPVLDNLLGLRKIYAGGPETYWKGAVPILSFETIPQLGSEVDINLDDMKAMVEQFYQGLQREFFLSGMTAKLISPNVVDPTAHINVQLEAICIKLGIPKRVFMGSERGELASSQDDAAWNDRLRARQKNHVTPRIIIPFIDRLIILGVLPQPAEGYSVAWKNLDSLSDQDKAGLALTRMQALGAYLQADGPSIMTPHKFLTSQLGMTDEEAESTLQDAEDEQLKKEEEDAKKAMEAGFGPDGQPPIDPNAQQGGFPPKNPNGPPMPPGKRPPFQPSTNFDPDQPRDGDGKFAAGGGGAGSGAAKHASKDVKAAADKASEDVTDVYVRSKGSSVDPMLAPAPSSPKIDAGTESGQAVEGKTDANEVQGSMSPEEKKSIFQRLTSAYTATKDAAVALGAKLGKPVWDKLPVSVQSGLTKVYNVGMAVEHHLEGLHTKGQEVAKAILAEKGLSDKTLGRLTSALNVADTVSRWGPNIPVLHSAIHSMAHIGGPVAFLGAKVGYYVPVASLAFVATSPIHSPFAAIKAARNGVRKMLSKRSAGEQPALTTHALFISNVMHDEAGMLAEAIDRHDSDWFEALLYAALDETSGDVLQSIKLAEEYLSEFPEEPELNDDAESFVNVDQEEEAADA